MQREMLFSGVFAYGAWMHSRRRHTVVGGMARFNLAWIMEYYGKTEEPVKP